MDRTQVAGAVIGWYARHARDLPWRRAGVSPWGVLVSEFMLQQTPVSRVLGPWQEWLARWPAPADLAAAEPGEAVRAWGRLGYPRRALRLHEAAAAVEAAIAEVLAHGPKTQDLVSSGAARCSEVGRAIAAAIPPSRSSRDSAADRRHTLA